MNDCWLVEEGGYNKSEAHVRRLGEEFLARATAEGLVGLRLDAWENMGWYYALRGGNLDIHPSSATNVDVFPHKLGSPGGIAEWMGANTKSRLGPLGRYTTITDAILDILHAGDIVMRKNRQIYDGILQTTLGG